MSGIKETARNKEIDEGAGGEEGIRAVKLVFVREWINFTKLGVGVVRANKLLGAEWGIWVKGYIDEFRREANF